MNEFDGPHFSPDLIGPDGNLSRLHKGGKIAAARAQKQATAEQSRIAAAQAAQAQKLAEQQAAYNAREEEFRTAELAQNQQRLDQLANSNSPATQYIDGRQSTKRKRSAFGLSATRGFGLGGSGGGELG